MLSILLHAKLVWMPSVCYILNYYMQNFVYLYLVLLLPHRFAMLLALVAASFETSACRLLRIRGRRFESDV